ncbi:MAG: M23 family metallopeptidase, partial [Defluviitaleaceae bacterium]|nr:M23 family metallopeptidase [Defluviitaleaceae bacterium]
RRSPISGRQENHTGIDIPAPTGSDVIAAASGTVTFVGWQNGFGNTVIIYHGDNLSTLYAHNSRNLVSQGAWVEEGQVIAAVGSTGWSTGPHVHFETRVNGSAINPMNGFLQ